jgi:hypothetical protein
METIWESNSIRADDVAMSAPLQRPKAVAEGGE